MDPIRLPPDEFPTQPVHHPTPVMRRVQQMSESHCGPAVLEMLLDFVNVHVSQATLTHAIHADQMIEDRGLRVDELAKIIRISQPTLQFWYKDHSTIQDLDTLVHVYHYPVGVEWQGLFYDSPEEEAEDLGDETGQFGHYSIVADVEIADDLIVLRDPYREFSRQDRFFSLKWFVSRWWDENENTINSYPLMIRDDHMIFIITPKGAYFPKSLGMIAA
jgi:transcriptional regulator with XRE-family HTH domain